MYPHIFSDDSTSFLKVKYTNLHGGTYSLRQRSITHTFPILFRNFFSKFFGPFFGGPWGSCTPFSNSPSPATYPHIFSDVSNSFLKVKYTNLHGGTYFIRLTFPILFPKIFFQNFWGPFLGPQGLLPSIFEFPFSRCISLYFSDVSTFFALPSSRYSTSWWKAVHVQTGWPTYGLSHKHGPYSLHLQPQPHLHHLPFTMKQRNLTSTVTPTPKPPPPPLRQNWIKCRANSARFTNF